jgi:hypothetical protein
MEFFLGGLFQLIIESFGFWVHTQLQRRVMSGFGTQNLNKWSLKNSISKRKTKK